MKKNKKNVVINSEYELEEILCCTPYATTYNNAHSCGLDENEFMRKLYVKPFENMVKEINSNIEIADDENERDELVQLKVKVERQLREKKMFENGLLRGEDLVLRHICGKSGSGKSTYLGKLFIEYRKKGHLTHRFDLSSYNTKQCTVFGKTLLNEFPEYTLSKLLFAILSDIVRLLEINNNEGYAEYIKKLKNYTEFYYNNAIRIRNIDFEDIFKPIQLYCQGGDETTDNYITFSNEMCNVISSFLKNFNTEDKIRDAIYFLLRLYILLFISQAKETQICFFAVDGIEHFIDGDEVFDADIVDIIQILESVLLSLEGAYSFYFNNVKIGSKIKFVVTLRDTTKKMLPTRNAEDYEKREINISEWFAPSHVVEKRLKYFSAKGFKVASTNRAQAIKLILKSEESVYYDQLNTLSAMHNSNKRRLNEYLCKVLNIDEAKRYLKLYKKVERYDDLARQFKDDETKYALYRDLKNDYIRALRDFIVVLLLNAIDEKDYFINILAKGGNFEYALGKSYARRILTYLAAKKNKEQRQERDNYIGFNDILRGAFQLGGPNGNETIDDGDIKRIASVLFNLSNPSKDDTHWCQNIVIKFNNKKFNEDELIDKMINDYSKNYDNIEQFGVKITPAGRWFLKRMASYEYFICRYIKGGYSLFDETNLRRINNGDKFKCISIIKEVKKRAFACIDDILDSDRNFFDNYDFMNSEGVEKRGYLYVNERGKEQTHVERLIDNHISYLDSYRNLIIDLYHSEETGLSKSDFEFIINFILETMLQYAQKLETVVNEEMKGNTYYIQISSEIERSNYLYYRENITKVIEEMPLEYCRIQKREKLREY